MLRHPFILLLSTSFLFLNSGATASSSSISDDTDQGGAHSSPTPQAWPFEIENQCYRVEKGQKTPLFDVTGKHLDDRFQEGTRGSLRPNDHPMRSPVSSQDDDNPPLQSAPRPDTLTCMAEDVPFVLDMQQRGTITACFREIQEDILSWLFLEPKALRNLLETCRFYGALVTPINGHLQSLSTLFHTKKFLISLIGGQSGDVDLFIKDQQEIFTHLTLEMLREIYISRYYQGALAAGTPYRKAYLDIGPESVVVLDHVQEEWTGLYLQEKKLRLVLIPLSKATQIRKLLLRENQLRIAPALCGLTALQYLDLSSNHLICLGDFSSLTALKQLYLFNNCLTNIQTLSSLTALQMLNLSGNLLMSISDLSPLTGLKQLYLFNNRLTNIQTLSSLAALECLDISQNQLTSIGDISPLTVLKALRLSQNRLTSIGSIAPLRALEYLDVSQNQLTSIGDISSLTALKALLLSQNLFTSPSNISALTALEVLDIFYNNLTTVPDVSKFINLKTLYLNLSLCQDETLLSTLRKLNSTRESSQKLILFGCTPETDGKEVSYREICLD